MTVKKMSKILTFILVLAMVLGTVAMAADGDPVTTPTYTITAGTFTNGSISLTLVGSDGNDTSLGNITATDGKIENIAKDSKVKVVFVPNPGYEFVGAKDGSGKIIKDGDVLTITDNLTITPVFAPKASLGSAAAVYQPAPHQRGAVADRRPAPDRHGGGREYPHALLHTGNLGRLCYSHQRCPGERYHLLSRLRQRPYRPFPGLNGVPDTTRPAKFPP